MTIGTLTLPADSYVFTSTVWAQRSDGNAGNNGVWCEIHHGASALATSSAGLQPLATNVDTAELTQRAFVSPSDFTGATDTFTLQCRQALPAPVQTLIVFNSGTTFSATRVGSVTVQP